jgi:hypothetical protein
VDYIAGTEFGTSWCHKISMHLFVKFMEITRVCSAPLALIIIYSHSVENNKLMERLLTGSKDMPLWTYIIYWDRGEHHIQ